MRKIHARERSTPSHDLQPGGGSQQNGFIGFLRKGLVGMVREQIFNGFYDAPERVECTKG